MDRNDSLFSFVNALLCNGYELRIGALGEWEDFYGSSEEIVTDAYNEVMAQEACFIHIFPVNTISIGPDYYGASMAKVMALPYENEVEWLVDYSHADDCDEFIINQIKGHIHV
jgi:hypothetical protein